MVVDIDKMGCSMSTLLLALLITLTIVVLINLFGWKRNRDQTATIYRKLFGMICSAVISVMIIEYFSHSYLQSLQQRAVIEFSFDNLKSTIILPVILTLILFAGPLLSDIRDGLGGLYQWDNIHILVRNIFAAPIVEEILFRDLLIHLLIQCFTPSATVLIGSLLFSLSHLPHHFVDEDHFTTDIIRYQWPETLSHLTITFIFAAYASMLRLRTNSIISPIIVHSLCNYFAAPRFDELFSDKVLRIVTIVGAISFVISFIVFMVYA
ncbi:ras converting CAAX endopeptidase Sras [Brevipalpus obovatus]|uniref:ras converting CAAX endopeptidase Sras n=1 Tax=Brevipalpus obovatus TaxID=246614 RepID=UPI003D9F4945